MRLLGLLSRQPFHGLGTAMFRKTHFHPSPELSNNAVKRRTLLQGEVASAKALMTRAPFQTKNACVSYVNMRTLWCSRSAEQSSNKPDPRQGSGAPRRLERGLGRGIRERSCRLELCELCMRFVQPCLAQLARSYKKIRRAQLCWSPSNSPCGTKIVGRVEAPEHG